MKFATSVIALVSAAAAVSGAAVELQKRLNGEATWFNLSGYTACGSVHSDNEYVVAVNTQRYDSTAVDGNPNNNRICRQQITIHGRNGPVTATIVDRCGSCKYDDLDLSPALFQATIGDLGLGRMPIRWDMGAGGGGGGGGGNGGCLQTHTVNPGDFCWDLGQRFGVSVAQIISWNPSVNAGCTNLQIGQQLCVRK
ncbi:hypothetical protein BDV98DRAFT_262897 [Pterulicium gracile]|uniref:LysM domain-containing protein n=1 Tax=Pterulicium gracile TaxID=1884261 RepID=A0A5C3Q6I9_9AGAR|nr:hypothetical protein BDV98DRAFT_262897 [Pterula gracilis]